MNLDVAFSVTIWRYNVQILKKGFSMRLKEFHEKKKLPEKTMLKRVDKNVPNLRERFFRFFIVTIITSSFICEKC